MFQKHSHKLLFIKSHFVSLHCPVVYVGILCLSVFVGRSVCQWARVCFIWSIYLSNSLSISIRLLACLAVCLSNCIPIFTSVCLCLFVCLFICLSDCLFNCFFVSLSISLLVYMVVFLFVHSPFSLFIWLLFSCSLGLSSCLLSKASQNIVWALFM